MGACPNSPIKIRVFDDSFAVREVVFAIVSICELAGFVGIMADFVPFWGPKRAFSCKMKVALLRERGLRDRGSFNIRWGQPRGSRINSSV